MKNRECNVRDLCFQGKDSELFFHPYLSGIFIFFFPEAVISGFWKIISCFQEKNGLVSNFNFTVEPVLTFKARLLQQNCCHFIHNRLTPSKNVYLKNGGENPYLHLGMPPNITTVFQNLGVNTCIL